jgi:3-oxoacyl-[acyl-carrier-protein] synthase II
MKRRVVVTGMGVVTSLSRQVDDLFDRLCRGESGIHPIERFDASRLPVKFAGEVRQWSAQGYLAAKEEKRLDRFTQFALVSTMDAVRDAGIEFGKEDPCRCGVIIGSAMGGLEEIEAQLRRLWERGPDKVSAFTIPKMLANVASGHVAIQYGLRGPSAAVVTACASASDAIADAFRTIQYDDADVMITGGTEATLTPLAISGFAAMGALSTRNDDPAAASRPFAADRDGFVMSEGAGILVLEELEHAVRRGARIYAELLGCGASTDGYHITQPHQEGAGAALAMQLALQNAGLHPEQIGYINAHGTSTLLGDKAETLAIKSVFKERAPHVPVSSTKSQLGHLLGAAGGVELILTVVALGRGVIPPTINYHKPDPDCDLDYVPNEAREAKFSAGMSNSFGFGGHNASLIVGLRQSADCLA